MSRRSLVAAGVGVTVAAVAAVALGLAVGGSHSTSGPPRFRPGPGKFRLTPKLPGNGIPPQPRMLSVGSTRLVVTFGGVFEQGGRPLAALAVAPAGTETRPVSGRYRDGAVLTVGADQVRVLGVYDQPGEDHDAVDLQVSTG